MEVRFYQCGKIALLAGMAEGNQCSAVMENVVLGVSKKASVIFFPVCQFCLLLSFLLFGFVFPLFPPPPKRFRVLMRPR